MQDRLRSTPVPLDPTVWLSQKGTSLTVPLLVFCSPNLMFHSSVLAYFILIRFTESLNSFPTQKPTGIKQMCFHGFL